MNLFKKLFAKKSNLKIPFINNPTGTIIAAKVTKIEKHPNADRLRVISLSDGVQTIEPVVCGAFNFNEGDMVVLAKPGAYIPKNIHSDAHEGFTLDKAKIRGVESQGMICAAFELGMSEELGDGVMVLPRSVSPGTILG